MSRRLRSILLVTLILATGGALRLWYASGQLHINRFEDEQYSLQNVRSIYHTGSLHPKSGYYPSPVFNLPQVWALRVSQALFEKTGDPTFEAVGPDGRLRPTGFFLTRAYQALCGTLSLLLLFLIGRRLFSDRVGLLAALLLAFLPWGLHSSGYNKPDALLMMAICLAMHTSMRAVEKNRVIDHVWVGVAIALAMSAKLTGGLIAVPLIVATTFFLPTAERVRRVAMLAVAGASSALAFVALNPYWQAYLHFIRGLQKDYAGRTEASRFEMPLRVAELHLSEQLFGPLLGSLAILGFVALAITWSKGLRARLADPEERLHRILLAMLLAFPVFYTMAYAAQTSYFKPNNFLPIVPSTTLALAWLLDGVYGRLARRLPGTARGPVSWLVAGVLTLAVFLPGYRYVERSVVPTTYDLARGWLDRHLQPAEARLVLLDRWRAPGVFWEGSRPLHGGLSALLEADLSTEGLTALAAVDAVVLRRDLPDGPPLVEQLMARFSGAVRLDPQPRLFSVRGPPLTVVMPPWRRHAKAGISTLEAVADDGFVATAPPEAIGAGHWTVFVWLPQALVHGEEAPRLLREDGSVSELVWTARKGKGHLFLSRRFPVDDGQTQVRLETALPLGEHLDQVRLEIHRWTVGPGDPPRGEDGAL